jgi:hypothetical protein
MPLATEKQSSPAVNGGTEPPQAGSMALSSDLFGTDRLASYALATGISSAPATFPAIDAIGETRVITDRCFAFERQSRATIGVRLRVTERASRRANRIAAK